MEKALVWGLILLLAGLAGLEAMTRRWHQQSVDAVDQAFQDSHARLQAFIDSDEVQDRLRGMLDQGMPIESAEIRAFDEAVEANPDAELRLTIAEAEAQMSGFPSKSVDLVNEVRAIAIYRWGTLLKDYGGIRMDYMLRTGEIVKLGDFTPDETE